VEIVKIFRHHAIAIKCLASIEPNNLVETQRFFSLLLLLGPFVCHWWNLQIFLGNFHGFLSGKIDGFFTFFGDFLNEN
jgi:hypothetical protein